MGWSRLTLPYKSWKMCHAGLTFFFCLQYSISRSTLGGGPFIQLVKCIMRNKRKLQSPFVEKNQSQHLYAFYEASFIFGARTCTLLGFVVVLVLLDCVEQSYALWIPQIKVLLIITSRRFAHHPIQFSTRGPIEVVEQQKTVNDHY